MQTSKIHPQDVEAGSCSKCYAVACEPILTSCYQSCVMIIIKLVILAVLLFLAYGLVHYYWLKDFKPAEEEKSVLGYVNHLFNM